MRVRCAWYCEQQRRWNSITLVLKIHWELWCLFIPPLERGTETFLTATVNQVDRTGRQCVETRSIETDALCMKSGGSCSGVLWRSNIFVYCLSALWTYCCVLFWIVSDQSCMGLKIKMSKKIFRSDLRMAPPERYLCLLHLKKKHDLPFKKSDRRMELSLAQYPRDIQLLYTCLSDSARS